MGKRILFVVPPDESYKHSFLPPYVPLGLGIIKAYLIKRGVKDIFLADMREMRPMLSLYIRLVNIFPFRLKMFFVSCVSFVYHQVISPIQKIRRRKHLSKKKIYLHSHSNQYSRRVEKIKPRHINNIERLISSKSPDIIGFACLTYDQLFYALDLCRFIKKTHPHIKTLLGGPYISKHVDDLCAEKSLCGAVDYYISGDAEEPVYLLVKALEEHSSLDNIPNLTYYARGKYHTTSEHFVADKEQLSLIPDFSGLRVYDSLILRVSLGCYWGKCAYCTYRRGDNKTFFMPISHIIKLLGTLRKRYKVRSFYFKDDALPPAFVRRLCRAIIKNNLDIQWNAFVCCDEGFDNDTTSLMRMAGCRNVLIGLDSFSPRMLKLMGKMQTPQSALKVLKSFERSKISVSMCLIFGFPGETRKDAQMTLDFVKKYGSRFGHISPEIFVLEEGSQVFVNPKHFGVKNIRKKSFSPRMRRPECFTYEDSHGLTEEEKQYFYSKVEEIHLKSKQKK